MKTFIINFLAAMGIVDIFFEQNPDVALNASNAFLSFLVVYFMLWLLSFFYDKTFFRKLPKILNLLFFFMKELLKANFRVASDVLSPRYRMSPGIIAFPLKANTVLEITILANMISLTPGSMIIDVSDDRKILYIHTMYIKNNNLEQKREEVRNGFEKKILEITR